MLILPRRAEQPSSVVPRGVPPSAEARISRTTGRHRGPLNTDGQFGDASITAIADIR
jgi:hypothetical protein